MSVEAWPLLTRFPSLASLPRLSLRRAATPVESLAAIAPGLWIKRDDLTATPIGGNKVRSLELLLGDASPSRSIVTAGARASTHALSTALHGAGRARDVIVATWPQEMNPLARIVAAELAQHATVRRFPDPVTAVAWLWWRRFRGDLVIPAGGTTPPGIIGHVNAAFELVDQIRAGQMPEPKTIVVPLGTGGTTAGLALGFALAGLRIRIVAVRVVPRIVGRIGRVIRLARQTAELLERIIGRQDALGLPTITIAHQFYGGAYGRPLPAALDAAQALASITGIHVDATYSAKALAAAVEIARREETLFWLTFDARWITSRTSTVHV